MDENLLKKDWRWMQISKQRKKQTETIKKQTNTQIVCYRTDYWHGDVSAAFDWAAVMHKERGSQPY